MGRHLPLPSLMVLVSAFAWGCGSSDIQGATCNGAAPCGGDVDGTWQIDTVCVDGDVPAALATVQDLPSACNHLFQSVSLTASGKITFADGTETDDVTESMDVSAVYTSECIEALTGASVTLSASTCSAFQQQLTGASGVSNATCTFSDGSCRCSCSYQTQVNTTPQAYTISSGTVTYTEGSSSAPIHYCVSGSSLTASQALGDLPGITMISTLHKL